MVCSVVLMPFMLFVVANVCVLVECNRVPFDIPEAESELVAGFMTEYSSLYFSIIVLSEYLSMLVFALLLVLLFNLYMLTSLFLLFSWCTTRATLNRLKYDELLHLGWYMLLLLVFALFMLFLFV
jgi:NADH-quinone oxidoreductase subunit H